MGAVALKLEHHIYYMLQHLRPRYCSLLVDMPYQEHRHAAGLGVAQQPRSALPHLRYRACRGLYGLGVEGLDGVYHQQRGVYPLALGEYILQEGFIQHQASVCASS